MTRSTVRPRLRLPWMLLGCAAVLAIVVGIENRRFSTRLAAGVDPPPALAAPAANGARARLEPPPASRYIEIAERPLFIPDRRPQQDVAVSPAAPPPPAPALLVQGVVLSPEHRYAVIQHGNPPKLESVAEGATIDGWQVEHIDAGKVALRLGTATVDYIVGKPNAQTTAQPIRPPLLRPRVLPGK